MNAALRAIICDWFGHRDPCSLRYALQPGARMHCNYCGADWWEANP